MSKRLFALENIFKFLYDKDLINQKEICEIGTGRYPLFPFLFSRFGAKRIVSTDLNRYLLPELYSDTAEAINEFLEARNYEFKKFSSKSNLKNIFKKLNIEYLAPFDFCQSKFNTSTFDLIFSNAVFEHVEKDNIDKIHKESFRILRKDGYVLHNIDLTDHFSHSDNTISPLRFLKYSDRFWDFLVKGTFFYQNRVRVNEHIEALKKTGFKIIDTDITYFDINSDFNVHDDILKKSTKKDSCAIYALIFAQKE